MNAALTKQKATKGSHDKSLKSVTGRFIVSKPQQPVGKRTGSGVVEYCVQGSLGKASTQNFTPSKLIERLKTGLPVHELDELRGILNLPMEKLVSMLGMSKATFHRRKIAGRLGPAESDRLVRFARLMGKAIKVMESVAHARLWLNASQVGLGGAVPLEYAETEVGAREVEDLLGRIEYGVYA